LVYVPNSRSDTVSVIDQAGMRVIDTFPAGQEPQHVVPSYDLRTLYVAADYVPASGGRGAGSLTPINPATGKPGPPIPVDDPYNLYFTPDGRFAIVVAEARRRLDFYDPHTWLRTRALAVPSCAGVDHLDFTADGRTLLASCEFADRVIAVDVARQTLRRTVALPGQPDGMPQDVKLSPDGTVFYVADMMAGGVYLIDSADINVIGFLPTGRGAHGLYVDRTATRLFITNRGEGSISVLRLATRRLTGKWRLPGHASPDMGNLSADGTVLWLSGRYDQAVYAISTVNGHLIKRIPVGSGPHGLCVWPQPGFCASGPERSA
jgi:YVTN family beta-propeller protein